MVGFELQLLRSIATRDRISECGDDMVVEVHP